MAVVAAGSHVEGRSVTVTGAGYLPNTVVTLVLPSSGVTLGSATTDASGSFTFAGTLPIGTSGKQTVQVLGVSIENLPITAVAPIVITAAPSQPLALAFTGVQTPFLASIGAALLFAGIALTGGSRKRKPESATIATPSN